MRLLADLHFAPRTVQLLRSLGHDVLRVTDLLLATASDETIVERAAQYQRIILTQDFGMTAIIALSRRQYPSLVTLRLSSVRIEFVTTILQRTLPILEQIYCRIPSSPLRTLASVSVDFP